MILYLFGGSSSDANHEKQQKLILIELKKLRPRQILDITFARTDIKDAARTLAKFRDQVEKPLGCRVLDAGNEMELKEAQNPLIFVGGGDSLSALYHGVTENSLLFDLILKADYYFGSSAGAMLSGEKQRQEDEEIKEPLPGLALLRETVIEPHYTQWHKEKPLRQEMRDWHCRYGIGIDEACALVVNPAEFPKNYRTIGEGKIEVVETE